MDREGNMASEGGLPKQDPFVIQSSLTHHAYLVPLLTYLHAMYKQPIHHCIDHKKEFHLI